MANIFFLMSHTSHQITTFPLAKKLLRHSHSVRYCGPPVGPDGHQLQKHVVLQGFDFVPLDPYCQYQESQQLSIDRQAIRFQNFLQNLNDGNLYQNFIRNYTPDLIILDIFYLALVIPLTHLKVPVLLASTQIAGDKDQEIPPLESDLIPGSNDISIHTIEAAWDVILQKRKKLEPYYNFLRKIAKKYQFDFDRYFYRERSVIPFGLRLPELIFWDADFDFTRTAAGMENKYYLGNQVDLSRKEDTIKLLSTVNEQTKIVYVSLGTRWSEDNSAKAVFLEKFLTVAQLMPGHHFVIAAGSYQTVLENMRSTENITICNYAPQIAILAKASLMVTHAGGSIKECIRVGVPMLCYPFDNDQFGMAARVVHHGLGLRGNHRTDNSNVIKYKICKILNDSNIPKQIDYFRARALHSEKSYDDVTIIERFIANFD